jgi:protein-disulfide isomerase
VSVRQGDIVTGFVGKRALDTIVEATVFLIVCALVGFHPHLAAAQSPAQGDALQKELRELRDGQRRLEADIEAMKKVLLDRSASQLQDVVLDVEGSPFKGDSRARVTVVEYSDYQCPFCGRHARETLAALEAEYIRTGQVKYVFQDFPIGSIHRLAFKAHEGAHCAGEQGKYWEMHGRLFEDQKAMAVNDLRLHAAALGLDGRRFEECLDGGRYATAVRRHLTQGKKATVRGTPTFFVGLTDPEQSTLRAVKVIRGAQPYRVFKEAIDALLATPR